MYAADVSSVVIFMRLLRKPFLILFVMIFLIALVGSNPVAPNSRGISKNVTPSQTFTPKTVLFDESHCADASSLWTPGNASLFSSILYEHGYNSTTNFDSTITSALLDDFAVLVLFFPQLSFEASEITAITDFVDNGGGLLLAGVNDDNSWFFTKSPTQSISENFGITFNDDRIGSACTTINSHPITHSVNSIHLNGDDLKGCSLEIDSSVTSVVEDDGDTVIAAVESGSGRVVVSGGGAPFYQYYLESRLLTNSDDHHQFSVNVIDWLTGNPTRDVVVSERNIIIAGEGPDLTPSEVEDYDMFVGLYHDHTVHSDGANTATEMLYVGRSIGLDFMLLTDHSYDTNPPSGRTGITGALEARSLTEIYDIDCVQFIGAELSRVKHTTGFPLYENIYTTDQQEAVDGIHAQGGIATLCHPTIAQNYGEVYLNYDTYGYDAIEILNDGYFFGGGEDAYFKNFLAASDGHSRHRVGKMLNIVFVENPSGPDGKISDTDLVDAVMNKRIVMVDRHNNLVFGQRIWVDRYLELLSDAESETEDTRTYLESLGDANLGFSLSMLYIQEAETALEYWIPTQALRSCELALTVEAQGITVYSNLVNPTVFEPTTEFDLGLNVTNTLSVNIKINSTLFIKRAFIADSENYVFEISSGSSQILDHSFHFQGIGYTQAVINIHDLNTTTQLDQVFLTYGGLIESYSALTSAETNGVNVLVGLLLKSDDGLFIRSGTIHYNTSSGQFTEEMTYETGFIFYDTGLHAIGDVITYRMDITDYRGVVFSTDIQEYTIVETTSTPVSDDMGIFIIIGGIAGAIAVCLGIIWYMKKQKA